MSSHAEPLLMSSNGVVHACVRGCTLCAYILFVFPSLAPLLPRPANNIAEMSEKYSTPLTPPGVAFAIWGLIFSLQLAASVVLAWPDHSKRGAWKARVAQAIMVLWPLGWVAEFLWQQLFPVDTRWSFWVCLAMLLISFAAFITSVVELDGVAATVRAEGVDGLAEESDVAVAGTCAATSRRMLSQLFPLPPTMYLFTCGSSINAAWLSVASSIGILLTAEYEGTSFKQLVPPAIILAVAVTILGLTRVLRKGDVPYGLALVWAFGLLCSKPSIPQTVRALAATAAALNALSVLFVSVFALRAAFKATKVGSGSSATTSSDGAADKLLAGGISSASPK